MTSVKWRSKASNTNSWTRELVANTPALTANPWLTHAVLVGANRDFSSRACTPRICNGRVSPCCGKSTVTSQPAATRSYSHPPAERTTSTTEFATTSSRYLSAAAWGSLKRLAECGFSATVEVVIASLQHCRQTTPRRGPAHIA
ncbi:hypothetical protein I552_8004 [Mycobacterium xenopi 3993]|nr:hypothetical protein I552_8004 [Mycobacterium xenopi 3993]